MRYATKKIALTGMLAALLVGGKWALVVVPYNVEIVTILLAVGAFAFGPFVSVLAAFAFVLEETLIVGFGTWVFSYLVYWPAIALWFSFLGRMLGRSVNNKEYGLRITVAATASAVTLTLLFGLLTSLVDVGLLTGNYKDFWQKFALMYARGVTFFAIHVSCNLFLFSVAFLPLARLLEKIKRSMFPPHTTVANAADNMTR